MEAEQQHVIQKRIYAIYPDLFLDNIIICAQFPQWLISMVDEKTNPNYVSLLKYIIYYIMLFM